MDSKCFRKETLRFSNTLFEHVIDACYVMTMENSNRRLQYLHQLINYKPYNKIQIIHNKGFKNCKKEKWITNPTKDISDFYGQIFTECLLQNYEKVLIFEDDFFFTDSFEDLQKYVLEIQVFLDNNNDFLVYNLGALPYCMCPCTINMNHYYYKGGAAHSVIYSQKAMKLYLQHYKIMSCASDIFWSNYLNVYCFHKPFCFQLCEQTENSQYWSSITDINYLLRVLFKADETHKHLFPFAYNAAKLTSLFGVTFILNLFKK